MMTNSIFLIFIGFLTLTLCQKQSVPEFDISDYEIRSIISKLRADDGNKVPKRDIVLDWQGHTTSRDLSDAAPKP